MDRGGRRCEVNDQDEMFEAATETPAFLGCPQHMPKQLPSGFDGVESAPSDEAKKALADGVERMRDKLSKIADIALAADAKCVNIEKIGNRWMECSKAICEIRKICGPDLIEKAVFSTGMYYTPGWLANLAKEVAARQKPIDPTAPDMKRKPTMDFGRFHVTRAAIPGRTVLTFRRKQEHLPEFGTVVPGRIIVANISKNDKEGKTVYDFSVKSYMTGELPRVIFSGVSQVSMSKTEKIVYKMVKCDIKETQRRHICRKRKAAAKQQAHDNKAAAAGEDK